MFILEKNKTYASSSQKLQYTPAYYLNRKVAGQLAVVHLPLLHYEWDRHTVRGAFYVLHFHLMTTEGKGKALPLLVNKTQRGDGIFGFHPYFGIQHNYDGIAVSSANRPHFTPSEILWYSFLLRGWIDPSVNEWGQNERATWNFPRAVLGIEPGTSHLVAQCVNQTRLSL